MITDSGKQILGRFLVGDTSSYASYLAIGCGPKPIISNGSFTDYSQKKSLDYEMARVPITSKNLITENGITKIILTAELSNAERYGITEIGIYPASTNPLAIGRDNFLFHYFSFGEAWKYHTSAGVVTDIPTLSNVTDNNNNINVATTYSSNPEYAKAFFTTSENALFENIANPQRLVRYEQPRYLSSVLLIRGDLSSLTVNGNNFTINSTSHIHLANKPLSLEENLLDDELRLAFSIVNKNGIGYNSQKPSNVKILIRFVNSDIDNPEYANLVINLTDGLGGLGANQWDFTNNRYVVVNKKLKDLVKTSNFTWDNVTHTQIYAEITGASGVASENFYIALDGLRFENVSSFTNVYGLTAYTEVKTPDALPITKAENTNSFMEFKFVVDVL